MLKDIRLKLSDCPCPDFMYVTIVQAADNAIAHSWQSLVSKLQATVNKQVIKSYEDYHYCTSF